MFVLSRNGCGGVRRHGGCSSVGLRPLAKVGWELPFLPASWPVAVRGGVSGSFLCFTVRVCASL